MMVNVREQAMRIDGWWEAHTRDAPERIRSFLRDSGVEVAGRLADLGCGDGAMAAGLAAASGASVVGFDLEPVDVDLLARAAAEHGMDLGGLSVEFRRAETHRLPATDQEFDLAVSWSVAEHARDLKSYFAEAWRTVKPYGHLYVQTWPLWHSEHGHHLAHWLDPFDHLRLTRPEIVRRLGDLQEIKAPLSVDGVAVETVDEYLAVTGLSRAEWVDALMECYDSCNGATLDEILEAVEASGFVVAKLEVMSGAFCVPEGLPIPLSQAAISGAEFVCWRRPG